MAKYTAVFVDQLKSYDLFSTFLMKFLLFRLRMNLEQYVARLRELARDGSILAAEILMPSNITSKLK